MRKSFQYRVIANRWTVANAEAWIESLRLLYNVALEQRIGYYRTRKKSLTLYDQIYQLPELRKHIPQYNIASAALQEPLKILDRSFRSFFRRIKAGQKPGFPRFKGKNRYNTITLGHTGWVIDEKHITINRVGRFKLFLSRPIEGKIKTVTLRRTPTGKWFVSFSCDEVPVRSFPVTQKAVGIDVGVKSFAVDSDGLVTDNPRFLKTSLADLRRKQRSLARKKFGSNRRQKAKQIVAHLHEKVSNQRKDFVFKLANHYARNYQRIAVEDLNIQGMVRNRHLSRSISDASWGLFFTRLSQVAAEAQREVIKVNPSGTSQFCSACGEKVPKVLSVRIHSCFHCGLVLDRDENAARNIKALGHRVQALTPAMLADVA